MTHITDYIVKLIERVGDMKIQIKRSGTKATVKVPASISSRLNSVRTGGHTNGKGTRNQGHTHIKPPKSISKKIIGGS